MKRILLMCFTVMFIAGFTNAAWAQDRTVSGRVTSAEDGTIIPGVSIMLEGTTNGTQADAEGRFSLTVPSTGGTLVFSFIGLTTQRVTIGAQSVIDVVMQADTKQLGEIVVTGYGTTLKKEFSGAVSTINAGDIGKLPTMSVNQALQGQAAGVFVTSSSGTPGGGINVRIRGNTSINASNDPLYVVDGVPVVAGAIEQDGFGGQNENALAGINPQDIQSIEVLKDASSTAIYGARAANGVVLITTKRGVTGKSRINLSIAHSVANEVNRVDYLSAQEWFDVKSEALYNDLNDGKITQTAYAAAMTTLNNGWDGETNTDWLDLVFRTAKITEYQINASGGDNNTKYFISGSYRDEEGVIIGSGSKRLTGRMNLDHNASDRLSFGVTASFSNVVNQRIFNDNNIYGILSAAILTPPTRRVRNEDGEFIDALPSFNTNAVRDAQRIRADNTTLKLVSNVFATYKIMNGLDFRTDLSYDYNSITEDFYAPASTALGRATQGSGNYNFRKIGTYIVEPTLRFSRTFSDVHSFNAVIGSTWQDRKRFENRTDGTGFGRESLTYITSAAEIVGGSSYTLGYRFYTPFFGRVNYSYDGKYIASASFRRDGSSRFGPNNRFGNFYAFSAGWNFSDENFMSDVTWLELGKVRASYGVTGNDGIPDFAYPGTWGSAAYTDASASVPNRIANNNLKWEETTTLDVGLELSFLSGRINLNTGYFIKKTTDLLFANPLPWTTGFGSVQDNIGEIENKGIEIDLNTINVNTSWGFKWSTSANITFMENKVVSLVADAPVLSGFASAVIEGYPLNTFYGLNFLGVDPATGESIFEDVNGDGVVNGSDNKVLGDYSPDFLGGFTNTFSYKGFTLDVFFQFVHGVDIFNNTFMFGANPAQTYGMDARLRDRWQQPGDITDVPKATTVPGLNATDNSRFLEDGSYLRLKNVALSYEVPQSIISKAKLRSARVFASATNLLTFTRYRGFDPEVSTFANTSTSAGTDFLTFPQTKMVTFGVNIGF